MPAWLQEMRNDLAGDSLVREFVTLPSHGNVFNRGGATRFEYFDESHENLPSKVALLQNLGYIREIRISNHPIWRMSEELVERLPRA